MKPHVAHLLNGAASVADLFGAAFRVAAYGLGSADVAALLQTPVGDVDGLKWIDPTTYLALTQQIDSLALRAAERRLGLSRTERHEIVRLLGGRDKLTDPRRLFILAYVLDARYAEIAPRTSGGTGRVTEVPRRFLVDISNPPPALGQMTPLAACRRWMRAFWYQGNPRAFDGFGSLPEPEVRALPAATAQSLQRAVDDEELRIALASWGPHAGDEVRFHASPPGCFAVEGFGPAASDERLRRLLDRMHEARVHVGVMPELALSAAESERLSAIMKTLARRFPALLVVGTTHRPRTTGGHLNEALVFAADGEIILRHEKIEPYATKDGGGALSVEDVVPRTSENYELLDTPVGRIAINICRDVRSDVGMILNRMLGVSVLLVPAYSRRLDFVQEEAALLGARQGAVVAAVNPPADHLVHACSFYAPILSLHKAAHVKGSAVLPKGQDLLHIFRVTRQGAVGAVISDAATSV